MFLIAFISINAFWNNVGFLPGTATYSELVVGQFNTIERVIAIEFYQIMFCFSLKGTQQ